MLRRLIPARGERAAKGRLREAFEAEERESIELAYRVRLTAYAVIALWLTVQFPLVQAIYYDAFLGAFAALAYSQRRLRRGPRQATWQVYAFTFVELALLTFVLLVPNPFDPKEFPIQISLRFGTFIYFFVFLALAALTYSPRLVAVMGLGVALCWSAAFLWIASRPDTFILYSQEEISAMSSEELLDTVLDPRFVDPYLWVQQIVVLSIVTGIVAVSVARARRLVLTQVRAARERTNLARYFSPNMVDALAHADAPLGAPRSQEVAVLFADIVGFTGLSERFGAEETMATLRDFHSRMADAVFAHGGTLDKYMGDAVMATFGTPRRGPRDALNALACARAMTDANAAWGEQREAEGSAPIEIGIGVHFGPVLLGDIGDERRLEFAVIGDTVNVASRLEALTRPLGARVIVSEALVAAARAEADGPLPDLDGFAPVEAQSIRGREGAVGIWALGGIGS